MLGVQVLIPISLGLEDFTTNMTRFWLFHATMEFFIMCTCRVALGKFFGANQTFDPLAVGHPGQAQ
jgi:hypothetical protein